MFYTQDKNLCGIGSYAVGFYRVSLKIVPTCSKASDKNCFILALA